MIKVIHVEDDDDIRELVGLSLEISGEFEVLSCASGSEALSALEGYSKIPALFVTARAGVGENKELFEAGALDVIVKPFEVATLAKQILTIFDGIN